MAGKSHRGNSFALKTEIGNTYGKLTVIERVPNIGTCAAWLCKCNCGCGTTKITTGTRLRLGRASSCKSRKLSDQEIHNRTHLPRKCSICKEMKPPADFRRLTYHACKTCRGRSHLVLMRNYGITQEDYDRILKEQGGGCAICGRQPGEGSRWKKYLQIDHEHQEGKKCTKEMVRGLLCGGCNSGLGYFRDDIYRMKKAIAYLEEHDSKIDTM